MSASVALVQGVRRMMLLVLQGCIAITAITIVSAIMSVAFAAEQPFAAPKAADPVAVTGAGSLAQVTLSLLLVLAAVFAAAWVVRRLRGLGRLGGGAIQIVADIALGTKERALLVQVGGQQLLIGVAPGRVSTLHVLAEPVLLNAGPHPNPPPRSGGGDRDSSGREGALVGASAYSERGDRNDSLRPAAGEGGVGAWARTPSRGTGVHPDFKAILKRSLGL